MKRAVVILCLTTRVIIAAPVHRQLYSHPPSRLTHSAIPYMSDDDHFDFNENRENTFFNSHTGHIADDMRMGTKAANKLRHEPQVYDMSKYYHESEKITPVTVNPLSSPDYELSRIMADAKYLSNKATSNIESDHLIDNVKSMMQYVPMSNVFSDYDTSSDFHNDDDDVRSNGRTMYDTYWPMFYHNPYEYESDRSYVDRGIDKRYITSSTTYEGIIPVHEFIEDDLTTTTTLRYTIPLQTTDNPLVGNEPFFSFVLNDYFEKNPDEDPLSFKGLRSDWGKDFDHVVYKPLEEKWKHEHHSEHIYTTPVHQYTTEKPKIRFKINRRPPGGIYTTTQRYTTAHRYPTSHKYESVSSPILRESLVTETTTERAHYKFRIFNNNDTGVNKNTNSKAEFDSKQNNYEGFKDFLDSFANKFGSEDYKKEFKYENRTNGDKGEKKKGFHRVYQKTEFQEDKEFFDNSSNNTKAEEKGGSTVHVGGSEGILKSQAFANVKNAGIVANESGNTESKQHEDDRFSNKFDKYINVAKQAAGSNSADYPDPYKV